MFTEKKQTKTFILYLFFMVLFSSSAFALCNPVLSRMYINDSRVSNGAIRDISLSIANGEHFSVKAIVYNSSSENSTFSKMNM